MSRFKNFKGGNHMVAQANNSSLCHAVVIGGNCIPFTRSSKEYASKSNRDILTATIDNLAVRFGIDDEHLDVVSANAVLKRSCDFNLTRECILGSALALDTPVLDIQVIYAAGMEALNFVSNMIELSQIDSATADGMDTTSDAPIVVDSRLCKILLEASHQKFTLSTAKVSLKVRSSDLAPDTPPTGKLRTGLSMDGHQTIATAKWGVTHAERNELTAASHQDMTNTYDEGSFTDLITPCKGISRGTNIHPGSTPERLAKLKPTFDCDLEA